MDVHTHVHTSVICPSYTHGSPLDKLGARVKGGEQVAVYLFGFVSLIVVT